MNSGLKPELLDRLVCPKCGQANMLFTNEKLQCSVCESTFQVINGKPIFTDVPEGMSAAPRLDRGPEQGSRWRQANWRFLEKYVGSLPRDAVILDFGAGHGDFNQILKKHTVIALDVFPYDEIDLVCDLQKAVPFKKACFDVILLMNVIEHVQQPENLVKTLAGLLRPDGSLVITVPFLLKLHQVPYDFYRYSHYQLKNIGLAAGLELKRIEGYYDPYLMMHESAVNMRTDTLSGLPFFARKLSRIFLEIASWFLSIAGQLSGGGRVSNPEIEKSPYPIGYHVVFCALKEMKRSSQ
jgi:SAM-dependent methyltransferase